MPKDFKTQRVSMDSIFGCNIFHECFEGPIGLSFLRQAYGNTKYSFIYLFRNSIHMSEFNNNSLFAAKSYLFIPNINI